jgi:putative phage-type endonuclease
MTQVIQITSEAQWLAERTKDITSTEAAVLFGLSPYKTEFELFHEKRDGKVVSFEPNERMKWGNRLESAIAHGAAEDQGWKIAPLKVYMRDEDARLGSSFDFEILSSANGRGILEVKNVDGLQYHNNWIDDGAGNIEAPEHIELQIQHQMEVAGYDWTALVALVGGNEQKIVLRNRDREIGKSIREHAQAFWDRVAKNTPPSADYVSDAEFIIKQLRREADDGLIAEADADLETLIERFNYLHTTVAEQEQLKQATRAQILERIGKASKVITSFGSLSAGPVKGRSGTLITQEMVGTVIGATEGHRNFRFFPKKVK